jgi:hypothetical protein
MQHATEKILIREFANRIRTVVAQRPDDQEALRRARVATRFYHSFCSSCPTPQLLPLRHVPVFPVRTHSRGVNLPTEIWTQIIGNVSNWVDREGRMYRSEETKTLMSLARTCSLFQHITEDYIYRLLPFRGHSWEVWRFHFSISIEPRRANLVRSLFLWWGDEHQRLVDLVRACPNLGSLALRWVSGSRFSESSQRHEEGMKRLLQSCPQVRTFRFPGTSQPLHEDADLGIRAAQFYKELTELETDMNTGWATHALSHYDFSNLTTLSLGQPFPKYGIHDPYWIPPAVYANVPRLQKLVLSVGLIDFTSLKDACIGWGHTLQHICLDTRTQVYEDFGDLLPFLPALEEMVLLSSGVDPVTQTIIESITRSRRLTTSRLRTVVLGRLPKCHVLMPYPSWAPPIDSALQSMMDILHPTLETLYLACHRSVQRPCLDHLKKAKKLRQLRIYFEEDVKQEDIDELAECTELKNLRQEHQLLDGGEYSCLTGGEPFELQFREYGHGWGERTW